MADSIRIRITGDDSEFLRTLASLEDSARATLDGLAAAAAVAGEAFGAAAARYGESLGAAGGLRLFESEEGATRQAARLAEAVARVWSGAAALEAPSLTLPRSLLDPEALLQSLRAALETDFSAAAEALRAALTEGYLRPGFEGVDWEGFAARFAEALAQTGMQGAQALAATAPALGEAGRAATAEVPAAMDASSSAAGAGRSTANGWISGFESRVGAMRASARAAARSITSAFNGALGIASPSKVIRRSGRFSGEGFILGYEESIREAQRTVRGLTGGLVSAATLPARNAAAAAQHAQAAGADGDDLSRLNVGLYIGERKIAEATAEANGRVSNARAKRLAAGWGHAR